MQIIVIGAGMAGASAAAELSRSNQVVVLERESHPATHSTGRSAAAYIPSYGASNPALCGLTALSRAALQSNLDGAAAGEVLSQRGLLTLVPHGEEAAQAAHLKALQAQFPSLADCSAGDPRFDDWNIPASYCETGWIEPDVADMDVDLMLQGYLKILREHGGQVLCDETVQSIQRTGDGWQVRTNRQTHEADVIVNCAGAWADEVAAMAGARCQQLTPMRRTAILFRHPDGADMAGMPMLHTADESFYMKPDAGLLLASPVDETPSAPCDVQPEDIDVATVAWHIEQAFGWKIEQIEHRWAGLRTFAPDRTPSIGPDPDAPGFYWLAGQGGHGIQTAPASARLLSCLVNGEPLPEDFVAAGFDPKWVDPAR